MRTIPTKEKEILVFAKNIMAKSVANASAWGITAAELAEFGGIIGEADEASKANENPLTKNQTTTARKNIAMEALLDYLRRWDLSLRGNKKVTEVDLSELGLPSREHHHHGPKPPPAEVAVLTHKTTHLAIKVSASVPQEGHPSERVTRPDYHGLLYRWRVEGEEWRERNTTRASFTLRFTPEQVGKKVEIIAAWINPRLEPGPWGDSITVLVN